jgi:hypothetical protein
MPHSEIKYSYWFFADTPKVAWIISVILKDLLWRPDFYLKLLEGCTKSMFQFNQVYDVKSVPQPDTKALLGINSYLQTIATGFSESFYASQDGACTDSFENFRGIKETYRMILLSTPLFSHWSIPLSSVFLY